MSSPLNGCEVLTCASRNLIDILLPGTRISPLAISQQTMESACKELRNQPFLAFGRKITMWKSLEIFSLTLPFSEIFLTRKYFEYNNRIFTAVVISSFVVSKFKQTDESMGAIKLEA